MRAPRAGHPGTLGDCHPSPNEKPVRMKSSERPADRAQENGPQATTRASRGKPPSARGLPGSESVGANVRTRWTCETCGHVEPA